MAHLQNMLLINIIKYNKLDVSKLVTHKFNGIDKLEEVYNFIESKDAELIKPIVIM